MKIEMPSRGSKHDVIRIVTMSIYIGLFMLLTSCYSFDKEVALKQFAKLKRDCEIVSMTDYECSGTFGECWYVNFKYREPNSTAVLDTTLQYWFRDEKWITREEMLEESRKH